MKTTTPIKNETIPANKRKRSRTKRSLQINANDQERNDPCKWTQTIKNETIPANERNSMFA